MDGEVGGVDRGLVGMEDCDYYDASAVKGGSIQCCFLGANKTVWGSLLDIGGALLLSLPGAPQRIRLSTLSRVNKRIQGLLLLADDHARRVCYFRSMATPGEV